jgi:hypothetical protein
MVPAPPEPPTAILSRAGENTPKFTTKRFLRSLRVPNATAEAPLIPSSASAIVVIPASPTRTIVLWAFTAAKTAPDRAKAIPFAPRGTAALSSPVPSRSGSLDPEFGRTAPGDTPDRAAGRVGHEQVASAVEDEVVRERGSSPAPRSNVTTVSTRPLPGRE